MNDLNNFEDPTNLLFDCQQYENRRAEWPRARDEPFSLEPEALTRLRTLDVEQVLGQGNVVPMVPLPFVPGNLK